MGYMNFKNPTLEKVFKSFKWTRNITIQLLETAEKNQILDFAPKANDKFSFQPVSFQFLCIVTTTDTYFRKVTGHKNHSYGVLVQGETVTKKSDIPLSSLTKLLEEQLKSFENILKNVDEKEAEEVISQLMTMSNHEYLHHGELLLMIRQAGVELPDRFRKAWALG